MEERKKTHIAPTTAASYTPWTKVRKTKDKYCNLGSTVYFAKEKIIKSGAKSTFISENSWLKCAESILNAEQERYYRMQISKKKIPKQFNGANAFGNVLHCEKKEKKS